MRFLSAEEVARLAEATPDRYKALVYLLAYGGLRIGEASALKLDRLDLLRGRVQVIETLSEVNGHIHTGPTKSKKSRTVSLPPFLREMLERHIAEHPGTESYVFGAPEGGPIRLGNFRRRVWSKAVRTAGLQPLRIHDLRHTCAALLVAQGAHAEAIADRLGHSSPMVTMTTYAHVLPSLDERLSTGLESTFQAAQGAAASVLLPQEASNVREIGAAARV